MCRCAGVPARMTDKTRDVGTRCAGVPARMTAVGAGCAGVAPAVLALTVDWNG
jgi:hypothetical protein